ncbi:hypothetical protein ACC754_42070, partial [Rhizobium johnstonii]
FSIGVSRLMTALKNLGKLCASEVIEPVLVTVMDGDVESMGLYQKMTQELRAACRTFVAALDDGDGAAAEIGIFQLVDELLPI